MKISTLAVLIFTLPTFVFADAGEVTAFLKTFPAEMSCDGIESNAITRKDTILSQKVVIKIHNADSNAPEIEVISPSSSELLKHFKMGNGFIGNLQKIGFGAYYFQPQEQVLYMVRAFKENQSLTFLDVIHARDSGQMSDFSSDRIGPRNFRSIKLRNCLPTL